jgi:hypothetical protein
MKSPGRNNTPVLPMLGKLVNVSVLVPVELTVMVLI